MAVYTPVTPAQAQALLNRMQLGQLRQLTGITAGIENSNYFLTSTVGNYVLTVFERLGFDELPYYLELMRHLASKGLPVPMPQSSMGGEILHSLGGKPCALVDKLEGKSHLDPTTTHCLTIGAMLARLHLAAADFAYAQPNLRGLPWCNATVPVVLPHVSVAIGARLQSELALQNTVAVDSRYQQLPRGPVHADLFRDNALFVGDALSGIFDFYFAGNDTWAYDIAVCLNDWCVHPLEGTPNAPLQRAFFDGYNSVRPVTPLELELLPLLLRAAALRFWLSRLWDYYLPRAAVQLTPHDPSKFERILQARCRDQSTQSLAL